MTAARSCVDCKRLSEQFRLAGETLSDITLSRNTIRPQDRRRTEELIGFLSELRHLNGRAFSVHRRENHHVAA
jgi:hypothetical protein